MDAVCVFVNYNGQWDGTSSSYVGGEMKGILVPDNSTYVGLVELVRSVIGIRGPDKNIVMRYGVEPGLPLVRIQCDADVKFYIQLKKKDVHVLSKFPVTIDVLDKSAAEAMPAEVGASNHIDIQRSRDGGQSDEAMQHVNDSNTIIPPPLRFPSPTVGLDSHNEYEIEKQDEVMHNGLCTAHDDCNAEKMHNAADSHRSNEKSIAASIGGHSIVNNTRSENDKVSTSDSLSDGVIVADYTPVTMMRGSEMFVVKRFDNVHTCSIEIVQGHHRQAKIWMIGECVKEKYLDPTNTLYRPSEIMRDMQDEFGVSFNYLRAWRGKEAALNRLRGDDAESYKVNHVYPDAAFGICVQHLAANLKTILKTYFDGASRSYFLSEFHRHMESIRGLNPDMHRYLIEANPTKWSRAYFNGRRYAIMTTNIAESFNNVDRKARLMPVGLLVEWLRALLQRWPISNGM
ncbi:hypothetical protein TIFTF001_007526 [Ficus carica]|uniref:Uncharacterized protein n=1 Tax=Ficus carica TaxID=3494 RepID=A0AA87ZLG3_FICCA|nr:hypothetical protein TIFTF001_007526 [Ficus carica]